MNQTYCAVQRQGVTCDRKERTCADGHRFVPNHLEVNTWQSVNDAASDEVIRCTMAFVARATMNCFRCFGTLSEPKYTEMNDGERTVTARKGLASQKTNLFS